MFKTVIGPYVAPTGTPTESEVLLAAKTLALVAPKKTILFDGVGLKLTPLITIALPTPPLMGEKDEMVGWARTIPESQKVKIKVKKTIEKIFMR
jgi:hypothetical protein